MTKGFKEAAKNSVIYSFGNVATKIVGFILLPIYTNSEYLKEVDYGVLTNVEIVTQLLIAILGISLYQSLVRWYWDNNYIKKQKRIVFTITISILVFSLICYIPFQFFIDSLSLFLLNSDDYHYLLKLVYLSAFLQAVIIIPFTLLKLQSKPIIYSISNIFKLFLILSLTLYFVVIKNRNVVGIFEAQCIGNFVLLILLIPYILKNIEFKFEFGELKELIKYSFPLILASISGVLLSFFDRFGLTKMRGLEDTAIYGFGFKIANTIKLVVISSIQMSITPIIFKKMNDPDAKEFYKNTFFIISLIVLFSILLVSMFSSEIINIFATNKTFYLKSIYVISIISFSFLFGSMKDVVIIGLHIKKKTKIIGSILILIAIINFILNYLLIPLWGIYGASVSTLLAQIIFFIIVLYKAQKVYPIPYEFIRLSLLTLFTVVIVIFSYFLNDFRILISISLKLLLIVIYMYVTYNLIINKEEKKYIIGFWEKWKNPFNISEKFRNNKKSL